MNMRNLIVISTFLSFIQFTAFSQNQVDYFLIMRNTGKKVLANADTIRVFGFATSLGAQPNVPGPTLIANEGDSVHINAWNVSQGAPHTIHLHGLDVDQANDGVPHLSFDIGHMEHGYYNFKAPHAGTYLYHCHVTSAVHVQAGMYGLIIIKPTDGSNTTWNGGYAFEREHAYFLSEIDTNWHTDTLLNHAHDSTLAINYVTIPKYNPQFFLINGFSDQQLAENNIEYTSGLNEVNYVRLASIGYCGVRVIFPPELNAKIISSDGRPFPTPQFSDTIYIFPGERFGILTESSIEFQGEITYEYFNLNTLETIGTQVVPVTVVNNVGLENIALTTVSFEVVPNPFEQKASIQFELENSTFIELSIFDLQGKLIFKSKKINCNKGINSLSIGDYFIASGSYLVQLTVDEKNKSTKKVVKL